MMFFEGYIGAPPTVTVCSFICAYAGIDAVAAKASAATAIAVGRIEGFMSLSPCAVRAARAAAHGDTKRVRRGCARTEIFAHQNAGAYRRVSLPLAITGPVGCPVGDPPGGSSEIASAASGVRRPARSGGIVSRIACPGWMS